MSHECVRCVVKLELKELQWEESPGSPIHLTGPPIFLRVCVLGQLQHTPLLRPMFPLHLQDTLTFDRVVTNCPDPSLLKEIITGEHINIEMIQVSEDYEGGKILARYETPAELFLFPEPPTKSGKLRVVALRKSRKYRHCPHLKFKTSTTLTKVTSHIAPFTNSSVGGPEQISKPTVDKTSKQKEGVATQDKLRLLLSPYMEPHPQQTDKGERGYEPHTSIPNLTSSLKKNQGTSMGPKSLTGGPNKNPTRVRRSLTSPPTDLYQCCTAYLGPHSWAACPRRNSRKHNQRSKSTPPLIPRCPAHRHREQIDVTTIGPSWEKHNLIPHRVRFEKPRPFTAGTADPRTLARRDFCGQNPGRAERHFSGEERVGRRGKGGRVFLGRVFGGGRWRGKKKENQGTGNWPPSHQTPSHTISHQIPSHTGNWTPSHTISHQTPSHATSHDSEEEVTEGGGHRELTLSQLYQHHLERSSAPEFKVPHIETEREIAATVGSGSGSIPREDVERSSNNGDSVESFKVSRASIEEDDSSSPPPSPSHLLTPTPISLLVSTRRQRHDLMSKYLQHGNGGMGMTSPATLIENKLNALIHDCCECKHSAESLGEDDMTEDNERLRASLSAEREDQLNRSAKLLPDQSVLIGVGGANGEDYWSQRMAEFQGKHHRLVFHETIEKIYRRLYQNATNIH